MFKDKISKELVRERMAYPYEIKVRMTERRLSEFITYYGESGVAVSISGGLDSTAAMHFIHARYPDVEAVSVLGIECRDNIKMVMKIRDEWGVKVNIAAPKMTQEAVIREIVWQKSYYTHATQTIVRNVFFMAAVMAAARARITYRTATK